MCLQLATEGIGWDLGGCTVPCLNGVCVRVGVFVCLCVSVIGMCFACLVAFLQVVCAHIVSLHVQYVCLLCTGPPVGGKAASG